MYETTHIHFIRDRHWDWTGQPWDLISNLRENLGDNDPMEPLQNRRWFTDYNGVWIRRDCIDTSLVTYFALTDKHA